MSESPVLVGILPHVRQQLDLYIAECPEEISGFGEVEVQAGQLVITAVHLLVQEVTPSETVMSGLTIALFLAQMVEQKRPPEAFRFWWHSHASHETYFSPTDEATIAGFDHAPWWLSFVGNHRGSYEARLDIFPFPASGIPIRVTKPVRLVSQNSAAQVAKVRAEILQRVSFKRSPVPVQNL